MIYDSIGKPAEDLQVLTYKLCYLGCSMLPAPLMNANKLWKLVGERGPGEIPIPHEHFDKNLLGLYYL